MIDPPRRIDGPRIAIWILAIYAFIRAPWGLIDAFNMFSSDPQWAVRIGIINITYLIATVICLVMFKREKNEKANREEQRYYWKDPFQILIYPILLAIIMSFVLGGLIILVFDIG